MKFQPAVYEHAARLINRLPWDVSRNFDLLVRAHGAAYELYHHSPISVGIDIYNLEAEAYGGVIEKPYGEAIPSVIPPFKNVADLFKLKPNHLVSSGRIGLIINAGVELAKRYPDALVKIPLSGPFSLATNLVGAEVLLMQAICEPQRVSDALLYLSKGQIKICQAIQSVELQPIIFESGATPPLISPFMFNELLLPALKILMDSAVELFGFPQVLIIGGDTCPVLDEMLKCYPGYLICPYETDQNKFMKAMKPHPEIMVRLNMNPAVFIKDDEKDAFAEANRVMKIAGERENVCIGTGALAFEANPKVVLAVKDYIESN